MKEREGYEWNGHWRAKSSNCQKLKRNKTLEMSSTHGPVFKVGSRVSYSLITLTKATMHKKVLILKWRFESMLEDFLTQ